MARSIAEEFRQEPTAEQLYIKEKGLGRLFSNNTPTQSQGLYLEAAKKGTDESIYRLEKDVSDFALSTYGNALRLNKLRYAVQHPVEAATLFESQTGNPAARPGFLWHDIIEESDITHVSPETLTDYLHLQKGHSMKIVTPIITIAASMDHTRPELGDDKNRAKFYGQLRSLEEQHPEFEFSQMEILDATHTLAEELHIIMHGEAERRKAAKTRLVRYRPRAETKLQRFGPHEPITGKKLEELINLSKDESKQIVIFTRRGQA
jgi:hypothetical protein